MGKWGRKILSLKGLQLFCNKKKSKGLAGLYCNFMKYSSIYSLKTFTKIYAEEPLLTYLVFFIYMRGMGSFSLREC